MDLIKKARVKKKEDGKIKISTEEVEINNVPEEIAKGLLKDKRYSTNGIGNEEEPDKEEPKGSVFGFGKGQDEDN